MFDPERDQQQGSSWIDVVLIASAVFFIGLLALLCGVAVFSAFAPCSISTAAAIDIKSIFGRACP